MDMGSNTGCALHKGAHMSCAELGALDRLLEQQVRKATKAKALAS